MERYVVTALISASLLAIVSRPVTAFDECAILDQTCVNEIASVSEQLTSEENRTKGAEIIPDSSIYLDNGKSSSDEKPLEDRESSEESDQG